MPTLKDLRARINQPTYDSLVRGLGMSTMSHSPLFGDPIDTIWNRITVTYAVPLNNLRTQKGDIMRVYRGTFQCCGDDIAVEADVCDIGRRQALHAVAVSPHGAGQAGDQAGAVLAALSGECICERVAEAVRRRYE